MICTFYQKGQCRNGSQCRFEHPPQRQGTQLAVRESHPGAVVARDTRAGGAVFQARLANGRSERLEISRSRKQLLFSCAFDVSGSMSGAPIRAALACLEEMVHDVMRPADLFACCTFGTEVKKLHAAMPLHAVDLDRDLRYIQENAGGRTALWDGVGWAVEMASYAAQGCRKRGQQPPIVECLILTDGHDNSSSKHSFEQVRSLLASPGVANFNAVVVGLGDVDRPQLSALCAAKHAHFLYAKDVPALKQTLREVVQRIKISLSVSSPSSSTTVQWEGREKDACAALGQIARSGTSQMLSTMELDKQIGRLRLGGPGA
jgi:Mg-chelatase subunit ChlD